MSTERLGEGLSGSGYRRRMLVVCSLGWATIQGGRFLLPPLLPRIQATLALSASAVGLALTAFGLVYAATQYPSGTYSDALGRATLILPAFLVLLASFALLGLAVVPLALLGGVVLLGVGKGLYASPTRALLGDLYAERRGRALGIYAAGTDLGGLAAAGLAVAVLATTTWRAAFLPVLVLMGLVAVLFVAWNEEPVRVDRVDLSPGATARRLLATPRQRTRLVAFSLFYFVVGGLTNFLPAFLVADGFSPAVAGATFALLFAVGILTKPAAGEVSDRFPRLGVSLAGLGLAAVGLSIVLLAETLAVVAVGVVLTALGYKTQFPIADALVMEAAPEGNVGGDLGAARGAFLAANAVGPGFVGVVADLASYDLAFWGLVAGLLLSGLVLAAEARRPT